MVAGGQVVVLYSNHCMGIGLGGLIIGRLKEVVYKQIWLYSVCNEFNSLAVSVENC